MKELALHGEFLLNHFASYTWKQLLQKFGPLKWEIFTSGGSASILNVFVRVPSKCDYIVNYFQRGNIQILSQSLWHFSFKLFVYFYSLEVLGSNPAYACQASHSTTELHPQLEVVFQHFILWTDFLWNRFKLKVMCEVLSSSQSLLCQAVMFIIRM